MKSKSIIISLLINIFITSNIAAMELTETSILNDLFDITNEVAPAPDYLSNVIEEAFFDLLMINENKSDSEKQNEELKKIVAPVHTSIFSNIQPNIPDIAASDEKENKSKNNKRIANLVLSKKIKNNRKRKTDSSGENSEIDKKSHKKPFKCNDCQRCFRRKDYLIKHERIHTGEKPFKCNRCQRGFSQQNNLNRHMLIHI